MSEKEQHDPTRENHPPESVVKAFIEGNVRYPQIMANFGIPVFVFDALLKEKRAFIPESYTSSLSPEQVEKIGKVMVNVHDRRGIQNIDSSEQHERMQELWLNIMSRSLYMVWYFFEGVWVDRNPSKRHEEWPDFKDIGSLPHIKDGSLIIDVLERTITRVVHILRDSETEKYAKAYREALRVGTSLDNDGRKIDQKEKQKALSDYVRNRFQKEFVDEESKGVIRVLTNFLQISSPPAVRVEE